MVLKKYEKVQVICIGKIKDKIVATPQSRPNLENWMSTLIINAMELGIFPSGNFPSDNFPAVQFPKRQLSKG